ncbi:MAG: punA, partial [Candidatus Aminicenantes bacterium]|nr:punA [Candidatus Aminicenantes bacterium]
MDLYDRVMEAVGFVRKACPESPQVGLVLGSGLGEFADRLADRTAIAFDDIPHFKGASVAGHASRLVLGRVGPVPVAVLQGRIHYYEGHEIGDVVFPIRVLAKLG